MYQKITPYLSLYTLLSLLLISMVACQSGGDESAYEVISEASIQAGDDIPVPTDDVVLTISGNISAHNVGETLQLDLATIEKMGMVQYTLMDPYEEAEITYAGILMSDVVEIIGADENATSIHFVALDEYAVDIPIADMKKWPILLATQANGDYMNIENGGPTRIIYPIHAVELDRLEYEGLWIWSIETMDVQ